jgi:hypothetical protein
MIDGGFVATAGCTELRELFGYDVCAVALGLGTRLGGCSAAGQFGDFPTGDTGPRDAAATQAVLVVCV